MATEYGMIDPYEPGQVKLVDGKRIVSYGTSSYGYDIRCADEFKLFTNINSTIVDPKEFDENNFVDIKGDSVIIPPKQFRPRAHRRVLPHPSKRAHDLSRQKHLRTLRYPRERDTV